MRFEIDFSVANDKDAHRWLDRILYKIDDGWHVWDTTGQLDPNAFQAATWIHGRGEQGEWVREMLVASIKLGAWTLAPHGRCVRVTARPSAADELKPEDATRLAEEPLVILVENRISDGAFVERVVKELDKTLLNLWHRDGNPVRIDSLGGKGQIQEEVKCRMQKVPFRPRLVAIIDSDRKGPDAPVSETARRLCNECKKQRLPCWVLSKREAENYLPRILLDERKNADADHSRLVAAWDSLNDDQKNFFDMKNGLPDAPSAIEEALFQGLSMADRTLLSSGFGKNVYKCWTLWKGQAKTELLSRGQGDLECGVALIRKEV